MKLFAIFVLLVAPIHGAMDTDPCVIRGRMRCGNDNTLVYDPATNAVKVTFGKKCNAMLKEFVFDMSKMTKTGDYCLYVGNLKGTNAASKTRKYTMTTLSCGIMDAAKNKDSVTLLKAITKVSMVYGGTESGCRGRIKFRANTM